MRFIGSRVHGMLDYLVGALLIAAPWLFDFARGGAETWVPVVIGASAILYSLMTDYEMGVGRMISQRTHQWLDALSGLFMAASPWIFGFDDYVWVPHVAVGLLEIGTSLMTKRTTDTARHTKETMGYRPGAGRPAVG